MAAIYLAGRYGRREELLGYARELEGLGHRIVSTWLDGHHETRPGIDGDATQKEQAVWAAEDVLDVRRADWVVSFTEPGRTPSRGGRHVELGLAIAWRKRLVVVGEPEHVFHALPDVEHFPAWAALRDALALRASAVVTPAGPARPSGGSPAGDAGGEEAAR